MYEQGYMTRFFQPLKEPRRRSRHARFSVTHLDPIMPLDLADGKAPHVKAARRWPPRIHDCRVHALVRTRTMNAAAPEDARRESARRDRPAFLGNKNPASPREFAGIPRRHAGSLIIP